MEADDRSLDVAVSFEPKLGSIVVIYEDFVAVCGISSDWKIAGIGPFLFECDRVVDRVIDRARSSRARRRSSANLPT